MLGFQKGKGVKIMLFILLDDEQRCNFCVYWTGMRKPAEEFVYVDLDSAEGGIRLYPNSVSNGKPTLSCEGCSRCKHAKTLLDRTRIP